MAFEHQSVLLAETVDLLDPKEGSVIVDGTLGGGGHSEALLARGATVLGFDRDPSALDAARTRLAKYGARFEAVEANFSQLAQVLGERQVNGVLLDLGVSSHQLDTAGRGFSFRMDGPLDMRMGGSGPTAAELISFTEENDLADLIYQLGEERFSRPIARVLKATQPKTTFEAVAAVEKAVPRKAWPKEIHVATRTFQALRMAVNGELESLDTALQALPTVLAPGGVAAVITFHSLEDRAVKRAFNKLCGKEPDETPRGLPIMPVKVEPQFDALTKKPIVAADAELASNPRSRSAKLRGIRKRKP